MVLWMTVGALESYSAAQGKRSQSSNAIVKRLIFLVKSIDSCISGLFLIGKSWCANKWLSLFPDINQKQPAAVICSRSKSSLLQDQRTVEIKNKFKNSEKF